MYLVDSSRLSRPILKSRLNIYQIGAQKILVSYNVPRKNRKYRFGDSKFEHFFGGARPRIPPPPPPSLNTDTTFIACIGTEPSYRKFSAPPLYINFTIILYKKDIQLYMIEGLDNRTRIPY